MEAACSNGTAARAVRPAVGEGGECPTVTPMEAEGAMLRSNIGFACRSSGELGETSPGRWLLRIEPTSPVLYKEYVT